MCSFTIRAVLCLLSLAVWVTPWCAIAAGYAPANGADVALGDELYYLWPLEKPAYVNREGKISLQVHGDAATEFSEGLAGVLQGGKWGFIDPRGKLVIPPQFDSIRGFSEGMAAVQVGNKWGYTDLAGNVVIEPKYVDAESFYDGRALVNMGKPVLIDEPPDKLLGLIDRKGNWIVQPQWKWANRFSEGFACTDSGLIDRSGKLVVALSGYEYHGSQLCEGLLVAKQDGRAGYLTRDGKWTIEPQFAWGHDFSEGLAAVAPALAEEDPRSRSLPTNDRKYGYIDRAGKMTIQPQFAEANEFSEGLAAVRPEKTEGIYGKGNRWGYIDKAGKMVVPLEFNEAWPFQRGLAWVHRGGKLVERSTHVPMQWEGGEWLLIDKRAKVIWSEGSVEKGLEAGVFKNTRHLLDGHGYKCADMAQVVNSLRKLGKEKALGELRQHVQQKRVAGGEDKSVFVICRCLFENPKGWKPPVLFAPVPEVPDSAIAKLPHFPLMFSEGVPFFVIEGYRGSGRIEDPLKFLDLCESLPLRESDLPTKGYEAAGRALVASELFGLLYSEAATRKDMAKMIMQQASEKRND